MSKLSRRSVVTSAAALPVLAVPAVAAAGDTDARLEELAQEVTSACERLGYVCGSILEPAEEKIFDWLRQNPQANQAQEQAYSKVCGLDDAHAAEGAANDAVTEAISAICDTPARSIRGLIIKAKAAQKAYEMLCDDNGIDRSVVENLLVIVPPAG